MKSIWYFFLPVGLTALCGLSEYRCMNALAFSRPPGRRKWLVVFLANALLTVAWTVIGFPLPVFYILGYLLRAARFWPGSREGMKNAFLLNLGYVNMLAIHLVFIGAAALIREVTMHTLLASGFWRAMSASFAIMATLVENIFFLKWKNCPAVLAVEADSMEARPFMAFLWFCTGYLLTDSLLCVIPLEPFYPPLFLIGSSCALMFLMIRFLFHIYQIIQSNHLKDEHDQLSAALEARDRSAGTLKLLADRDSLTGVYSRRYALNEISALMERGEAFSLVFLDLDRLKQINDRDGHDAGDRYLIRFADAMGARLRDCDLLARVGGDEFVVLMPGCGEDAAARRMGAIRDALEEGRPEEPGPRFSYGTTFHPAGTKRDVEEVLREADRAMYQDKEQRR